MKNIFLQIALLFSLICFSQNKNLLVQANVVRNLVKNNKYLNKEIAFLIDMSISSSKNRFFIYDLDKNTIIDKGLVAHGIGSETGINDKLIFSNIKNSLATSLGKYYVGHSYFGRFEKAYKLYGLDKTNSNAYKRNIVLHKNSDVPYEEQLYNICNSQGCPKVNEKFFKRIETIIDNSKTYIILVIFYQ